MGIPDYLRCPAAWFYPRILVGAGAFLTQRFAAEMNITHVINCADDGACPEWFSDRYPERYLCLDAIDSPYVTILDWYPKFEANLREFLRSGSGVVYVHCQAGMNRSAYLALAYVCTRFHLDGEGTLEAVKRQRPCMFQNQVYRGQVLSFINGCLSRTEDPRGSLGGTDNRNAGLCASGGGSDLARLDVDTGRAPD